MADLQLAITYQTPANKHGANFVWAVWPVWALLAPLCIVATIAALSISPIIFPPAVTLMLLGISTFLLVTGAAATAVLEDHRIGLNREHLSFPLLLSAKLRFRRQLDWSDLQNADTINGAGSRPQYLKLAFAGGAALKLDFNNMSKLELEQLLMAVELWGTRCRLSEQLLEFQRQLQNENKGIEKVSYTRLWEDELHRRFTNTTFVPLEPGTELANGTITISRQLAFGGLSAIYLARRKGKDFVIVKEASTPPNAESTVRLKAEEHFRREAALLIKLDHPQIARVLDHFSENGKSYLILEYINGQDLRQFVGQDGAQSQDQVLAWAQEIAGILDHLHSQATAIIHRDLSPDNVMRRNDGSLVLIDFGAANESIGQATGTLVGKQAYMPLEQLRGKACLESDFYAFGATLYFLLTGQDPPAITASRPSQLVSVDRRVDDFIAGLTSSVPGSRPAVPGQLAQAVAALREQVKGSAAAI